MHPQLALHCCTTNRSSAASSGKKLNSLMRGAFMGRQLAAAHGSGGGMGQFRKVSFTMSFFTASSTRQLTRLRVRRPTGSPSLQLKSTGLKSTLLVPVRDFYATLRLRQVIDDSQQPRETSIYHIRITARIYIQYNLESYFCTLSISMKSSQKIGCRSGRHYEILTILECLLSEIFTAVYEKYK